jgi:hypothetical protein
MATLWLVDPATLPKRSDKTRKIGRKPLIDLAGLQAAISTGALEDDDVWLATRSSDEGLQTLEWTVGDLLDCVRCLHTHDHRGAEWCDNGKNRWFACDAYAIRYDDTRRCRNILSDVEYYLKFSIDENGSLTLIMIRVHLSR